MDIHRSIVDEVRGSMYETGFSSIRQEDPGPGAVGRQGKARTWDGGKAGRMRHAAVSSPRISRNGKMRGVIGPEKGTFAVEPATRAGITLRGRGGGSSEGRASAECRVQHVLLRCVMGPNGHQYTGRVSWHGHR